jgi:hypothetical protein
MHSETQSQVPVPEAEANDSRIGCRFEVVNQLVAMNLRNGWKEDKETLSTFKTVISFTFLSFLKLVYKTAQILTDSKQRSKHVG